MRVDRAGLSGLLNARDWISPRVFLSPYSNDDEHPFRYL